MPTVKVNIEGEDRQTLIRLVKAERRAAELTGKQVVTTKAQVRAVEFYDAHLLKLQKRLDPNEKYPSKY